MKIILATPRGFCAGVERAIAIVERALEIYGPPVYVRHEIVHNQHVVESLRNKGAMFVDEVDEVPEGAITVFSAHGVSQAVEDAAARRSLPVIDATCPLVAKVHKEGRRYARDGREIILIGHEGHPEVEGTIGRVGGKVHLVSTVEDVAVLQSARLRVTRLSWLVNATRTEPSSSSIIPSAPLSGGVRSEKSPVMSTSRAKIRAVDQALISWRVDDPLHAISGNEHIAVIGARFPVFRQILA